MDDADSKSSESSGVPVGPPRDPLAAIGLGAWPERIVDYIDTAINLVRDRGIRPILILARTIVFGIVIVPIVVVVVVLGAIGSVRLLDDYVSFGHVGIADLVVGALLVAAGLVFWGLRGSPDKP